MHFRKMIIAAAFVFSFSASLQAQSGQLEDLRRRLDALQAAGDVNGALPVAQELRSAVSSTFGKASSEHAAILARLGGLLAAAGRYREAEEQLMQAKDAALAAFGDGHVNFSFVLNDLALVLKVQGRYREAETHYEQALAIRTRAFGAHHPAVALVRGNLAAMQIAEGRYNEAESNLKISLSIAETAMRADDPEVGKAVNNLAALYWTLGRYSDAEPLFKRALAITEMRAPESPLVAAGLNNLAQLYLDQNLSREAEPLFRRALAMRRKVLPPDHPDVGVSLNNLAWLLQQSRRYEEALPLYEAALPIFEKLDKDHALVGSTLNNIALLHHQVDAHATAVPLFERAIAVRSKALGADNAEVGQSHDKLALALQALGRHSEAAAQFERALEIRANALGTEHPDVIQTLDDIASLYEVTGAPDEALDILEQARRLILQRSRRGATTTLSSGRDEIAATRQIFLRLLRTSWAEASRDKARKSELLPRAFEAAQWAMQTSTERALAQMAARQAKGAGALSGLVRERQDLASEWRALDRQLYRAAAQPVALRHLADEARARRRLEEINTRSNAIDAQIRHAYPDYFSVVRPEPMAIGDLQGLLGADEVLILVLDQSDNQSTREQTFVFAVSKEDVRWARSDLGTRALTRVVSTLRCGLDYGGTWAIDPAQCRELTGVAYSDADDLAGKPLPFDAEKAFGLYKALFGQLEDFIAGKKLLLVPSGPLARLPPHVLVTARPSRSRTKGKRPIAWLARSHAIAILPAVSSLDALRRNAKASHARKPFLGIGNPLLEGGASGRDLARKAATRTDCGPREDHLQVAVVRGRPVRALQYRAGVVDSAELRSAIPLPETADELCSVASSLGAGAEHVLLGGKARESVLKGLSRGGQLRDYRILHFATHGALAGEISGSSEPGLILSPPEAGTLHDDGYLAASEIAELKLDANWVILSACNTAAGTQDDTEALSGLARAFFYAGARALLVSHWYVNSEATVSLIQGAFRELERHAGLGRSEAMRRSMLAMIEAGHPPASWAPFVVVGEGALQR